MAAVAMLMCAIIGGVVGAVAMYVAIVILG